MESQIQTKITLNQLYQIQNLTQTQQETSFGRSSNLFAIYSSSNRYLLQNQKPQQLYSKDTLALPMIPIRRISCEKCVQLNLQCQFCQNCHKSHKTCCRSLSCIFELHNYLSDRNNALYGKCQCCKEFEPSNSSFSIDWRLLYLLQKLGEINSIKYCYFLHYKTDILYISQQEIQKQQNTRKINRKIFQESFIAHPDCGSNKKLKDQNMINLQGLFEQGIQDYVKQYQNWNQTNIQVSCYQIVNHFLQNKQLQTFKKTLQTPSYITEHEYISGYSLFQPKKYINVTQSTVKIDYSQFIDLSSAINKNILFFYNSELKALAVKNAKYQEKDTDISSTKIYQIMNHPHTLSQAVWFKDRKGDIFAIHDQFISIFKFHLKDKKFKQIVLRQDKNLLRIKSATSIIYIPQNDRIYYFDASNIAFSFCFQLYRPYQQQKEFSNCLSVNAFMPLPRRLPIIHGLKFIKASYAIEEVTLAFKDPNKNEKQGNKKHKEWLPVIYLLTHKRQTKEMLCLYRLIHYQSYYQLNQVRPQDQLQETHLTFDQNIGICAIFKKQKHVCICYQTQLNGIPTLIQGKISNNRALTVLWETQNLKIQTLSKLHEPQKTHFKVHPMKILEKADKSIESFKQADDETILLNDLAGSKTNNSSRYLAFLPRRNILCELILNLHEGSYNWDMHQCY